MQSPLGQMLGENARQLNGEHAVGTTTPPPLVVTRSQAKPRSPSVARCPRPPLPPFTVETALTKVQLIEDAWNAFDPHLIAAACTPDSRWRNKDVQLVGRAEIVEFLTVKRYREIDFALRMALWSVHDNRIAVRVHCEYADAAGRNWRGYGIELWEFDASGLMCRREGCINELAIDERHRRIHMARADIERGRGLPLR
ncbi:MAG: DUF1348 family protein [Actinomycetota bacterium]